MCDWFNTQLLSLKAYKNKTRPNQEEIAELPFAAITYTRKERQRQVQIQCNEKFVHRML